MRSRILLFLAVLALAGTVLYAQEAQVFLRPIEVHVGRILMGTGVVLIAEGATNDDFETTITVSDPTADRTWTVPNSASDTFVGLAATQTLTNKTFTAPVFTAPSSSSTGMMIAKTCAFVENATNTTHTCTIAVPAGAWLHSIKVTNSVLWTGGTATMEVGDTADPDGYFTGVDLKATDLVVGEVLETNNGSIDTDGLWGGKQGVYLVAASGRRGPTSTNFGMYYAAGSNILGVVTVGTPATTAGRTFMSVIYSVGEVVAVVSAGP